MNKYEIRTNKKKEAILNTALELFRENGFINTNIRSIADKAKVSQVSIYNYFGSKNLLVKEAISILMEGILSTADDILSEPLSFTEKVKKALSLCTEKFDGEIKEFFSVAALEDPQMVQAIISTMTEKKNNLYRKYLESGKAEGCINSTIPTETILDFINAIDSLGNDQKSINIKYREDILNLLFNGIILKVN